MTLYKCLLKVVSKAQLLEQINESIIEETKQHIGIAEENGETNEDIEEVAKDQLLESS